MAPTLTALDTRIHSSSWISSFRPRYNGELLQAWPVAPSYSAEQIIDNPVTSRQHHRRELFIRCFERGRQRYSIRDEIRKKLSVKTPLVLPGGKEFYSPANLAALNHFAPLANHLGLVYVFLFFRTFYFSDYFSLFSASLFLAVLWHFINNSCRCCIEFKRG